MSVWAVVSAPLVLSFDLNDTAKLERLWPIVANPAVLEINSAWAGHPGTLIAASDPPPQNGTDPTHAHDRLTQQWQVWAKPIGTGRVAVLGLNLDGVATVDIPFTFAQVPAQWWGGAVPTAVEVSDAWTGQGLGRAEARVQMAAVGPRGCRLLVLRAADRQKPQALPSQLTAAGGG